jgi:hypothetical protein
MVDFVQFCLGILEKTDAELFSEPFGTTSRLSVKYVTKLNQALSEKMVEFSTE